MAASILVLLLGLVPAISFATHIPFTKSFAHAQHGKVESRDLDWNPDMVNCASQCAVLVNAFSCKTSQCFCTNANAEGYRDCLECSINLNQNRGLLMDAQASQDELSENCASDGYPVDNFVVTFNDITYSPVALPPSIFIPPMGQTPQQTSTVILQAPSPAAQPTRAGNTVVYSWQPEPTTITTDGATIWYGGSSFGMAQGFTSNWAQSGETTVLASVAGFSTNIGLGGSSPTPSPSPLADNSANTTDSALNPQDTNTNSATFRVAPTLSLLAVLVAAISYLS